MTAPSIAQCRTEMADLTVHRGNRVPLNGGAAPPLASVVIPTFDAEQTLPVTLDSIAAQTWPNIEVVIADGGSRDGTLGVIAARAAQVSAWVSAPDRGIVEGFNRGVALATGAAVQIICADDRLGERQIEAAMTALQDHPQAAFAYGDVEMLDAAGRRTRMARGVADFAAGGFDSMALVPHMSLCARRETYEQVGLFDTDLRLVIDFDWLSRCWRAGLQGAYSPEIRAHMTEGGFNNRNAFARDLENYRITRRHGTMHPGKALPRLGARLLMDGVRLGLEKAGAEGASFAFRRWVDACLGRT